MSLSSALDVLNDAQYFPETEDQKYSIGICESLVMPELSESYLKSGAFTLSNVSTALGLKGPLTTISGGLQAIFEGSQMIRQGEVNMAIVIGASQEITEEFLRIFHEKKMLGKQNRFNLFTGEGMVFGEGSAAVLLENLDHAKARNAKIYCELENYSQAGSKKFQRMTENINFSADIVMANASGTELGDKLEAEALRNQNCVTAIKANTGWITSAAGIMDTVIGALMIYKSIIPPIYSDNFKYNLNFIKNLTQKDINKVAVHYVNIGGAASCLEISKFKSIDPK